MRYTITFVCIILPNLLSSMASTEDSPPAVLVGHSAPTSSLWSWTGKGGTGILLSGSGDSTAKLWNVTSATCLFTMKHNKSPVTAVCGTPDGKVMVTGDSSGIVRAWRMRQSKLMPETLMNTSMHIASVAISGDGQVVAAGDVAGTVCVNHLLRSSKFSFAPSQDEKPGPIYSIQFSPSCKHVAIANAGEISMWSIAERKRVSNVQEPRGAFITGLRFNGSNQIISCGGYPNRGHVRVWSINKEYSMTRRCSYSFSSDAVYCIDVNDRGVIAAGTAGGAVLTLKSGRTQLRRGKLLLQAGPPIFAVQFVRGTDLFASSSDRDRNIRLWHAPPE